MASIWLLIPLLLVLPLALCAEIEYAPIVQLNEGPVRGLVVKSDDDQRVDLYQGIRYGKAKRFEKPQFVEPWTEVYNATEWRHACPQMGIGKPPAGRPAFQTDTMSEDCLFLNVWKPETNVTSAKPVMVFIHGGGFTVGTIFTMFLDGKYIASRGDVVIVAMNYRLGAFGYLYGGTATTPGNLGYHDQILALQWVRANIHHFGGDPNQVTIFGESAGSWSVGSLIISPLAKGLFHRAIMQSGAPNSLTGGMPPSRSLENTKAIAHHLNCSGESAEEMVTCLQGKSMIEIVSYTQLEYNSTDHFFTPIYGDQLLPVAPIEALQEGKFNRDIDLIYGVTRDEGTMFALNTFPHYGDNNTHLTIESAKEAIVHMLKVYKQNFGDEVAQFYIDKLHNPTQDELKLAVAQTFGDYHIQCPTILFGQAVAKYSTNARFYSFRLTQHLSIPGLPYHDWMGVMHTDDLMYLFAIILQAKPEDRQLSHDMIRAWTNFAKNGTPGLANWSQSVVRKSATELSATSYFALNVHNYKMVNDFYVNLCDAFWKPRIKHTA